MVVSRGCREEISSRRFCAKVARGPVEGPERRCWGSNTERVSVMTELNATGGEGDAKPRALGSPEPAC